MKGRKMGVDHNILVRLKGFPSNPLVHPSNTLVHLKRVS